MKRIYIDISKPVQVIQKVSAWLHTTGKGFFFFGYLDESALYTALNSVPVPAPRSIWTEQTARLRCATHNLSFPHLSVWFPVSYIIPSLLIITLLCICSSLFHFPPTTSGPYTVGMSKQEWHKGGVFFHSDITVETPNAATHTHTHTSLAIFPKTKEKEAANIFAALQGGVVVVVVGVGKNLLLGWAWQTLVCMCVCACCLSWVETGVSLSETECSGFPQRTFLLSLHHNGTQPQPQQQQQQCAAFHHCAPAE